MASTRKPSKSKTPPRNARRGSAKGKGVARRYYPGGAMI